MLELRLNPFGATAIQSWCYSYTKLELRQHQVGATATLIQVGATNIKSWSYTIPSFAATKLKLKLTLHNLVFRKQFQYTYSCLHMYYVISHETCFMVEYFRLKEMI